MKLKRLSIFLVIIFLVSILPVNSHYRGNRIVQDDSFYSATVDYNLDFSICDVYKSLLTNRFINIIITYYILFAPLILTSKIPTRAPPQ